MKQTAILLAGPDPFCPLMRCPRTSRKSYSTKPPATAPATRRASSLSVITTRTLMVMETTGLFARTTPASAMATGGDGSYSFSQHHQDTCSHHGGVSSWISH
jgi:hypothetical protein